MQITPLQRVGHAVFGILICIYLAALATPGTKFAAMVHITVLYTLGTCFFGGALWLLYHSARAAITGKFF